MNKLKTYENFKGAGVDQNIEDEIDKVLQALVNQKYLISMLKDTIDHVTNTVVNVLPKDLEEFTESLNHYEENVHLCFGKIRDSLIDGYPNLKEMIEDIEFEFDEIEEYLKAKFPNTR